MLKHLFFFYIYYFNRVDLSVLVAVGVDSIEQNLVQSLNAIENIVNVPKIYR